MPGMKLSRSGRLFHEWKPPAKYDTIEWCSYLIKAYQDLGGAAELVSTRRAELATSKLHTPAGRTADLQRYVLAKAVPIVRHARDAIARARARADQVKATMVAKQIDKTDFVSALRRQEFRQRLAAMDPAERVGKLMGPGADPEYARAASEFPPEFSGITPKLHAQLATTGAAADYPAQVHELAAIEEAIAAVESHTRAIALDIQAEADIRPPALARLVAADPALISQTAARDPEDTQRLISALASKELSDSIAARMVPTDDDAGVAGDDPAAAA